MHFALQVELEKMQHLLEKKVCAGLDSMGLVIDPVKNDKRSKRC